MRTRTLGSSRLLLALTRLEDRTVPAVSATLLNGVLGVMGDSAANSISIALNSGQITVSGVANHAGTTPMDQRHDALLSAARFVEMVNRVVRSIPGHGFLMHSFPPSSTAHSVPSSRNTTGSTPKNGRDALPGFSVCAPGKGVIKRVSFDFHCSLAQPWVAQEIKPVDATAQAQLGSALCARGATAEGLACLSRAVNLDPADNARRLKLATTLAQVKQHNQAIPHFLQILRADPRNTDALAGLAASYAETNQTEKALNCLEDAMQIAKSAGNQKLIEQIARQIQLCWQRMPAGKRGQ